MAKKILLTVAGLGLLASLSMAASNPWGNLKKTYFYEAIGNIGEIRKNLDHLDAQALSPSEKIELMKKLAELGDRYYQKDDDLLAEAFYRKTLSISPPDAWPIYNKLEKISRRRGNLTWNFAYIWRQFRLLAGGFSSSLLMLNCFFSVMMFSGLLLFFVFTASLGIRYFKLAAHDLILGSDPRFRIQKFLLLLLLLLWPLALTGGWGLYPFLLCGLLWNYLNRADQANVKRIQVILLVLAFLFSLGQYLEKSMQSQGFQAIKKIYSGHLFPESTTRRFDNEMKVMQAYAYYHRDQADAAIDILQATGGNYISTLKSNLMGDIYYEKGNIPLSIQYYRQSLSMDKSNRATLKNFTVALLKNNDPELFLLYSKSYPEINEFKDKVKDLQKSRLSEKILWQRLLNFSWRNFHPWYFLQVVVSEFIKFPVLLAILIMAAYILLLKKLFPALGQSIFCSKCGKIIKKMSIEQIKSHALCDGCYQLFLIKDPIFLEAKILKEKEIHRQFSIRNSLLLLASLFIPGFVLNFKDKGKAFTVLFLLFFNIFGFFLFTALNFKNIFGVIPMFLNLIGIAAAILYLAINVYALKGYHDGF
jgi:tetratricopeptide (TPR) repeat protein